MFNICKIFLILSTLSLIIVLGNRVTRLRKEVSVLTNNNRAFALENNNLQQEIRVYKFTNSQLSYFNDSIVDKLNEVKEQLKIKDKRIRQLQYLKTEIKKTDSIVFKDTIFLNTFTNIDTLIKDEWFSVRMNLKYPNIITVTPNIKSEKFIIISTKKETIKPPHKLWIFRIFQRKHKVLKVDVVEKNPYVSNRKEKFIEIIK